MQVTYATEAWSDVVDELAQHWPAHWDEVAMHKDKVPLDPDFAEYARLEATGQLHVTVARHRGAVIGYLVAVVRPHLHYKSCLSAFFDLYYVVPSHRLWMTGVRLFSEAERALGKRGVKRMFTGTKLSKDAAVIFQRSGWDEAERLFIKYIGD